MPNETEVIDGESDLSAWAEQQAAPLRRLAAGNSFNDADLDWLNIAQEFEAVSRTERRELRNQMTPLLQHLLKWHFQPERRSRSWRSTIDTQRHEIEAVLNDNPSLRPTTAAVLEKSYPAARIKALQETGLLDLPGTSPFNVEQTFDGPLSE